MHYLSERDLLFVKKLVGAKILSPYKKGDFDRVTKNGGVALFCGDGDTDVVEHYKATVSNRPHMQALFGGILFHAPSFYAHDPYVSEWLIGNILDGMSGKKTEHVFLHPHYPCLFAPVGRYTIKDVFRLASEVHLRFDNEIVIEPGMTHSFFHIKFINADGKEQQRTYVFDARTFYQRQDEFIF